MLVSWPEGLVLWHGGEIVWRSWGPKALRPQPSGSEREADSLLRRWVDAFEGLGSGAGPLITDTREYLSARGEEREGDDKLFHDSYIAMRDAMRLIDADEGPGRVHSNTLQALADCRVRIENRTPEAELRQRVGFMMKDAEPHRAALQQETQP